VPASDATAATANAPTGTKPMKPALKADSACARWAAGADCCMYTIALAANSWVAAPVTAMVAS
jgi:hypothetical protein